MKIRSPETYWLLKNGLSYSYASLKEDADCDILVVGGGITGALMAFQLSREGYDTILIDKSDVAMGSTSATTGILQYELDEPLYSLIDKVGEKPATDTYKHGANMIDWINELIHGYHFNCGFEMKNSVYFSRTEEDIEWLRKEYECRKKYGLQVEWLSPAELLRSFHVAGRGAIFSSKAASVDAYALTHELLHYSVTHHGLRVFDRTKLEEVFDGPVVLTEEDCKISCRKIVYCTGYETPLSVANLATTYALVSEPLKVVSPSIYTSVFWDTSKPYFYIRATTDGRLLIGGADEPFTDSRRRDELIDEKETELTDLFRTAMPDMSITTDFSWAGTFGATKDSMPYIGQHPEYENSFFVLGYGGNGITFSLIAMQMLSDFLAGRHNRFSDYFRFNR
jgi:glycine/D-amino acid oxidase-like deaminating enzyme